MRLIHFIKKNWKNLKQTPAISELKPAVTQNYEELMNRIHDQKLTYLPHIKLRSIAETCLNIERQNIPGIFIEAGCALGGSSVLIASVKNESRPFYIYDVFEMIPPPSDNDTPDVHERFRVIASGQSKGIGDNKYYGYEKNLLDLVKNNFTSFGINCNENHVFFVKGLIQDTLKPYQPIAFAHVDVDWHDPVLTCLERIFPHLVEGGSIIIDDYDCWGGCKIATDNFLKRIPGMFITDNSAGSLKITKIKG